MKTKFDSVITSKMLDLIKQGHLDDLAGKRIQRPYDPFDHQLYTKESAVLLGVLEGTHEAADPRFCTVEEGAVLKWELPAGSEGSFIRKHVLYTEDAFGYPLDPKDWKFHDTPQLVFNAEQFHDVPELSADKSSRGEVILDDLCDILHTDDDYDYKVMCLAQKGIEAYNAKKETKFSLEAAVLRVEMSAMILSMDLGLPMVPVSPKLWEKELNSDVTEFRKAASDADLIASYVKHFSEEASRIQPVLREKDLMEQAASQHRPVSFFEENELNYVQMQNMKFLMDRDAALRKNRPELLQEMKQVEKDIKTNHLLKPSMMKRLDLFVGMPRKNVDQIISSFASEGLSWRILPMRKLVRSVSNYRSVVQKNSMSQ